MLIHLHVICIHTYIHTCIHTYLHTYTYIHTYIHTQCPKLRVHPAPGMHIFTAGCTIFRSVHLVCAHFLSNLLLLYIGRVHGAIFECTVLGEVHPVSAQNKSLISDTDTYMCMHACMIFCAVVTYYCRLQSILLKFYELNHRYNFDE